LSQVTIGTAVEVIRARALTAYRTGFVSTFDHLMGNGAVITMVGAVGCLFPVGQKDFVPSIAEGEWKPSGDEPGGDADGDGSAWTATAHAG
jgi:hypothetical protein